MNGPSEASHPPTADARSELAALLDRARRLEAGLTATVAAQRAIPAERAVPAEPRGSAAESPLSDVASRLRRSVIRPLEVAVRRSGSALDAASPPGSGPGPPDGVSPAADDAHDGAALLAGEPLWQLARDVTRVGATRAAPAEVREASATLQDLACRFAPAEDPGSDSERLAELRKLQAHLPVAIQTQVNGPYLVTNAENLTNWLGERLPTRPQMALCRCGQSATKPFCDGTHAEIGFKAAKDPQRMPDRRDAYLGQQVTIFDNRGTCQHSGYCTDRLATVFRTDTEPFVAPSGGRMDEIIRAVRDCPSGALSYAVDGREAREQVDYDGRREPAIEVSRDGPYRVTGAIALNDGDGHDEQRTEGASAEHYALCRCGRSQNKPFCSGMHWYVEFKDPVSEPDHEPTLFEWCGGLPSLTKMTRLFYEKHVPQDPLLAPLFANMSADHPERVASWLGEVFCGPQTYSQEYGGYPHMVSQHIGKGLTEAKRARWVALILQSAQEAGLPADPEFRAAFSSYIEWGSRLALENSQPGAEPPGHMPMPHWDWNTAAGPPGSRILALAPTQEPEPPPAPLPGPDEPVGFEQHVKPLFRPRDRQSMKFAFDLWAFDDVKDNAHAILERLRNGSMPCDGAWPQDRIDAFDRWVRTGMNP